MAKRQYNVSTGRVAALPRSERLRGLGATVGGGGSVVSSAVDISGKLDKVTFDQMFERVVTGTDADGNEEWYIRAKRNLLGTGEITAYGGGGAVGTGLLLGDLADVDAAGAEDGMALVYRDGRWVPGAVAAGGMDESALSAYLTEHDYLTRSTADNRYFYHRRDESGVNIDTGITAAAGGLYELLNPAGALPYGSAGKWYKIMDWGTNDPKYRVQLAAGYSEDHSLFRRQKIGGTWRAWTKILDEGNYAEVLDGRYVNATGDTMTGPLTVPYSGLIVNSASSDTSTRVLKSYGDGSNNYHYLDFGHDPSAGNCGEIAYRYVGAGSGNNTIGIGFYGGNYLEFTYGGVPRLKIGSAYSTIWHEGNDGAGSGLDADLLDGRQWDQFVGRVYGLNVTAGETVDWSTWLKNNSNNINLFSRNTWSWAQGATINVGTASINTESYGALVFRQGNLNSSWQMAAAMFLPAYTTEKMIYIVRATTSAAAGVLGSQSVLRYADYDTIINGNVATATRLQTSRSLWGQPFDGSADVSGDMTGVGNINTAAAPAGTIYMSNWFRSTGVSGWYNETYGGGIYMDSSIWLRAYQKPLYVDAIQSYGANSFGVGLRIYNSYCTSIEVQGGNYTMGLGCHNNGSWYWWRGTAGGGASGKSYVMQYNGSTWQFTGNMTVSGEVTAYNGSDARLKCNIRPVTSAIELLRGLGGYYTYDYIPSVSEEIKRGRIGLIYQHITGHMAELMATEREDGYGALNYLRTDYINLIGATVLEVDDKVERLTARVRELEKEVRLLKAGC